MDTDGYDKVKDSGNVSLGFIGAINSANNAIYMRSLDFSVYDGSKGEKGDTGAQGIQGPKGDTCMPYEYVINDMGNTYNANQS